MEGYYSVTEYSKLTGKDVGNIRRMLINGTLSGEKIGKQWVIPKSAELPKDNRVKSDKYHNWRQKNELHKRQPKLMRSLSELCEDLRELYMDNLQEVVIYGSYARGDETEESDVDMALVLNGEQTDEVREKMTEIVVDYELDLGLTLSVISVDNKEYQDWKRVLPFYKNVHKEGVVLWKTE